MFLQAICPECRIPLEGKVRNRALEHVLKTSIFGCPNKDCHKELTYGEYHKHIKYCSQPKFSCLHKGCAQKLVMADMFDHLMDAHKYPCSHIKSKVTCITLYNQRNGNLWARLYSYQNNQFLFQAKNENNLVYFNVFVIQPKKNPLSYSFTISTFNTDINVEYSSTIPSIECHSNFKSHSMVIPRCQLIESQDKGTKIKIVIDRECE
jgi:hypothetical protein